MSDNQLQGYIDRKLAGEGDPERDQAGDHGPGGVSFTPPDPVHAEALRRALAAELAVDAGDGEDDEVEEPASYDPGELGARTAAATAAMGFEPNESPPPTGQEAFFEAIDEAGRDVVWRTWYESLTPEDQAGVMAGDPEAIESFSRFVEQGALPTLAAVADQIDGARLIRDPLHRPLNRFRG